MSLGPERGTGATGPGPAPAAPGCGAGEGSCFRDLADALAEHVARAVVVPGKPVESLTAWMDPDRLVATTDEKTGFEQALGMAVAGLAAALVCKGTGVSHAWDSVSNAVVHGTVDGAPLLVVAADDLGARASTVVVDSRAPATLAGMAVLEPCSADAVAPTVALAASLSAAVGEPVLVRFTELLGHAADAAPPSPRPSTPTARPGERSTGAGGATRGPGTPLVGPLPDGRRRAHALTKPGRHTYRESVVLPRLQTLVDQADPVRIRPGVGRRALVGFGAAWAATAAPVAERLGWSGLGTSVCHPLPAAVVDFAAGFDEVVVVEEGAPVGEEQLLHALRALGAPTVVLGQGSGLLGGVGTPDADELLAALEGRPRPERHPVWKAGPGRPVEAPYDVLFDAVHLVRDRHGVAVTSCVGTVIDASGAPWHAVDVALSLGSATGTAAGIAATGRTAVALIGDYGLLHSGMNAYGIVQREQLPVLTLIVANGVSHRTGGQPAATHPGLDRPLDLVALLGASGAADVAVVAADDLDAEALADRLGAALDHLPATVILECGAGLFRAAPA